MCSVFNVTIFSYLLIYKYNLREMGFAITMAIKTVIEVTVMMFCLARYSSREIFFVPRWALVLADFMSSFSSVSFILFGNYAVWISIEINSYFAVLTRKISNVTSWTFTSNYISIIFVFCLGESAYLRTFGAIAIKNGGVHAYLAILRKAIRWGLINQGTATLFTFFCRRLIVRFYTHDPEVVPLFNNMLMISTLVILANMLYIFEINILRHLEMERL